MQLKDEIHQIDIEFPKYGTGASQKNFTEGVFR